MPPLTAKRLAEISHRKNRAFSPVLCNGLFVLRSRPDFPVVAPTRRVQRKHKGAGREGVWNTDTDARHWTNPGPLPKAHRCSRASYNRHARCSVATTVVASNL